MTHSKPSQDDLDALTAAAAEYTVEKDAADQAIADQIDAGSPSNDVNFSLRLPTELAVRMRKAAAAEQLRTSVWLRRLSSRTLDADISASDAHIERVVRRIWQRRELSTEEAVSFCVLSWLRRSQVCCCEREHHELKGRAQRNEQ